MTPFNLKGRQLLGMLQDNLSKVILSHIRSYEIVFQVPLGEFCDFHCCEDLVVFGVRCAETDSFLVGEGVFYYVVEDANFAHFIEDNGEVTSKRCK